MPILTPQERIGTCIGGRYRIERLLARGGMSVLFEARDTRTYRAVAVKLLKTEDCIDERRLARFLQEMRLTAELRDPHVVDVLDLGQDGGAPYLVMELLRGRTLQAELDARGKLGVEEALAVLLPVMAALTRVHSAGVVHRDVKPDNIFLHVDDCGRIVPKLLDFGIAKLACSTFSTRTGAVLGTPDYMAPEQVLGEEITPATDAWAMGAVLYRTLDGETPFRSTTTAQVLAKLAHEPAPLLRVPGVPPALGAAVDRALVRDSCGRYACMADFANAIVVCARETGFVVPEPARTPAAPSGAAVDEHDWSLRATEPSQSVQPNVSSDRAVWRSALATLALLAGAAIGSESPRQSSAAANSSLSDTPLAQSQLVRIRSLDESGSTTAIPTSAKSPALPQRETLEHRERPVAMLKSGDSDAEAPALAEVPVTMGRPAAHERQRPRRAASVPAKPLRLRDLPVAVEW